MKKTFAVIATLLLSCSCSHTVPVAVIGKDGHLLTGSSTGNLIGSSRFEVSDDKLTCSGHYNGGNYSLSITMPVRCNDGRKGFVRAYRDIGANGYGGTSGHGQLTLNDGYKADFVFGAAALAFH